jgi:succinate dehydrogenase/fumarate reductase flavoprotein subunit
MTERGSGAIARDHQADLVIVGAGAAGAMAALAANEQGATFVGLDQLPEWGGTAIVSGGGMSIAGSKLQTEKGIEDSPDCAYHDMIDGQTEADPAWVRFYYDHAVPELFEYLHGSGLAYVGVTLNEADSVPRRHVPKGFGLGLMNHLQKLH